MKAPEITKSLTSYNRNKGAGTDRIKYIVIHYVGATGGAKANAEYYASKYIGASAHYFVGFEGEIYQSVEDADTAWHCGASTYRHPVCRNGNSIGIEMCVRNKGDKSAESHDWYFEDVTVKAAAELTRYLMQKYNIPPEQIIRHYDVTGKICPNPYVYNDGKHTWEAFKRLVAEGKKEEAEKPTEQKPAPEKPKDQSVLYKAVVVTEKDPLMLRNAPAGKKIGNIPKGATVEVLGDVDGWNYVRYAGQTGYSLGVFLKRVSVGTDATGKTAVVATEKDPLTLRSTAEVKADNKLTSIPKGAKVEVLEQGAEWSRVRYGQYTGYGASRYLKMICQTVTKTAVVATESDPLTLRSMPVVGNNKLTSIPKGAKVEVLEQGAEWSRVRYGEYTGYSASKYLR